MAARAKEIAAHPRSQPGRSRLSLSRRRSTVTLLVTLGLWRRRRPAHGANSGAIPTRRDGRVVDGGGLEKRIGRFAEFAKFPSKVRTSRQIGRNDRLASRGVLTVPWCPDRYTGGDTELGADRLAVTARLSIDPREH